MEHGRLGNGIRKVLLMDNLGRQSTLHVRGDVGLREAIGDIWSQAADAADIAASAFVSAHWATANHITAYCGSEVEHFERPLNAENMA